MKRRNMIRNLAGAGLFLGAGKTVPGADRHDEDYQRIRSHTQVPKMKITNVETIATGRDVIVKIETDAGITGYGDATNHFLPHSVMGMLKDLKPYLLNEDPQRIEYLWQSCYRRRFQRGGPATGSAIAGIDQALWDIKGKACGMPVYQLIGGLAREKVRLYKGVGGQTAEIAANAAKDLVARGVTAIRFRAFHSYDAIDLHDHATAVDQQIEYLAAIREAVGEEIDLLLECHGRYDPQWAIKLASLAKPYNPFFIEDPIRHENPEALKYLREHIDIPIAIGERYHDKWDCREAIENQYITYLRLDINHCGGITEMKKAAAMAETYYIDLIPHNNATAIGSTATLHAALAIPNVTMMESGAILSVNHPSEAVARPFPKVVDGYALPPEEPGLGIVVDEKAAAAIPFNDKVMQPRLKGYDGSVRDF